MAKQYGLILPDKQGAKKTPLSFSASRNVFGEESDSESEDNGMNAPVRQGDKLKRQIQVAQEKVLEEDPTVYQYDELYDDIEKKKKEKSTSKKEEKKAKYIEKLLVTAEKRKKENERRIERQIQKEREEEGDKFVDKESFVTSSYKQKLEEMKIDEEKQRREDYLEDICDVTKQNDLGGFYRHLYDQQLNSVKEKGPEEKPIENDGNESKPSTNVDQISENTSKNKNQPSRNYRKRKHSGNDNANSTKSDSEDEVTTQNIQDIKSNKKDKIHLQSNIDADSDFSIDDSSSDESENEKSTPKENKTVSVPENKIADVKEPSITEDNFKKPFVPKLEENDQVDDKKSDLKEVKIKIDIWKKRTVGEVFYGALQRYYERKAAR